LAESHRSEGRSFSRRSACESESSVEANLGKVPLDKLMRLLQDIERSPGVVRVRRLHLRKSSDNKETLDVTMTVSAWQGA